MTDAKLDDLVKRLRERGHPLSSGARFNRDGEEAATAITALRADDDETAK